MVWCLRKRRACVRECVRARACCRARRAARRRRDDRQPEQTDRHRRRTDWEEAVEANTRPGSQQSGWGWWTAAGSGSPCSKLAPDGTGAGIGLGQSEASASEGSLAVGCVPCRRPVSESARPRERECACVCLGPSRRRPVCMYLRSTWCSSWALRHTASLWCLQAGTCSTSSVDACRDSLAGREPDLEPRPRYRWRFGSMGD